MAEKKTGTTTGAGGGRGTGAAKQAGGAGAKKAPAKAVGAANGPQNGPASTATTGGRTSSRGAGRAAETATGTGGAGGAARGGAGGTAKKASGATRAGGSGATGTGGARGGGGKTPDLKKDLRDFASARPQGWGHDDWVNFLDHLQSKGHNISEREEIGRALERERLDLALGRVDGLQPKARKSLVDRYGTVWSLRDASPDEVAQTGKIDRSLVDRIREQIQ